MTNLIGAVGFRYDPASQAVIFVPLGADGVNAASVSNPAPISGGVNIKDAQIGVSAEINTKGRLVTDDVTRVCGSLFETNTKDTQVWREAVVGTGSATQTKGEILLATGATANSAALYHTIEKGRFISGTVNIFRFVGALVNAPAANNERRAGIGVFSSYAPAGDADPTDGYGMYLNGTEFGFWYRSLSANPSGIVRVPSGSFSTGKTFTPSPSSIVEFEVEYTHSGVYYFINEELYHYQAASSDILSDTMNFHAFLQNVNKNGNTANLSFMGHVAVIQRYGKDTTTPITRRAVNAATTVLKTGPGNIHAIINAVKVAASSVTVWDGVTGAAPSRQILTIDAANFQGGINLHAPFRDGLTIVTDKAGNDLTIVYE